MARRSLIDPSVPLVTSLPTAPVDGEQIDYLADATNGVIWRFRYRLASAHATYKWEFVGGSELSGRVDTFETRAGATYGNLATIGPDVTVPLAGDYDVTISAYVRTDTLNAAAFVSFAVGATNPTDTDSFNNDTSAANQGSQGAITIRKTVPTAATLLRAQYRATVGTGGWNRRSIRARPVRVGP